jgi:hypothetical protein
MERQTVREADREIVIFRQKDRLTQIKRDRKTDLHREREIEKQTDIEKER